jgi:methionine biosynthesis protein MetW
MEYSPDENLNGFLETGADSLRYDGLSVDPDDAAMILSSLIIPQTKILDVGCGTGVITEFISRQKSVKIIGIEPDRNRVNRALERGLNVYAGYLSSKFINEHGPFDYIIFADVLEHLSNPAEIVNMSKKGLNYKGSILASVPNIAHWFVRIDLLFGRFDYQKYGIMDATHLRWFTRKSICDFFERLGFEITALEYTINITLPDYSRRLPWRWMTISFRRRFVRWLVKQWPTLFGCQFIIRATMPS